MNRAQHPSHPPAVHLALSNTSHVRQLGGATLTAESAVSTVECLRHAEIWARPVTAMRAAASYWRCAWTPRNSCAPVATTATMPSSGWVRTVPMPAAAWQHADGLNNTEVAEAFNAPLDQVVQRRLELARLAGGSSPPKRSRQDDRR